MSRVLSAAPGSPFPPGATVRDGGVNFSVFSRHAQTIDLCLYDPENPARETHRARLTRGESDLWSVSVEGLPPGTLYGYRVHGPWLPTNGMRFNSAKLLLDPYAKAIVGDHRGSDDMLTEPGPHEIPGLIDNAATALKSAVIDDAFDWGNDAPPSVPWRDTVIYETHVKGLTKRHPDVPENLRGSYGGLCQPAVIDYLKQLGITSVQLLPVHQHLDDHFLVAKGLTNYWGYNTIGFFAPHSEYASSSDPQAAVCEFKEMVRTLHSAGIEVILDVVYNHTAEGDEHGPSLMFRGFDNVNYYRHGFDGSRLFYTNVTGCGNSVASHNGPTLRLIMDSLRYWVTEMHVDGFRFDLAVTVGRDREHFHALSPFFTALQQDPVLARVKMIAEPWDVGREDSYQVGAFPEPWRELNGKFRDSARRFWRGDAGTTAEFAKRLCGSDDIFGAGGRPPLATVNFITSHDGYTLRDLFAYAQKHNLANGEDNRDGENDNHSTNCGHEGDDTDDEEIIARRRTLQRSMIATMFCSLGVPFICSGDERGRTQQGNNNAYCQDNEMNWIDWNGGDTAMLEFVRQMTAFRRSRLALRRKRYFDGKKDPVTGRPDVTWLDGTGGKLTHERWHDPARRVFGALIDSPSHVAAKPSVDDEDQRPLLLLFNQGLESFPFALPVERSGSWSLIFDTSFEQSFVEQPRRRKATRSYDLQRGSVAAFVLKT